MRRGGVGQVTAPAQTRRATLLPGAVARMDRALAAICDHLLWGAARAEAEGYQTAVVEGRRTRPDGTVVRWTNVFVSGHGGGTLVPFFIEWHDGSHPSADAASGLRLQALRAETPQVEGLRAVLK